ncbi:LysR family transcriptional regulator [Klebsiella pneumoniae]|nr:LysR family transcriptional regulator [Klebsiella pneumoniae]
MSFFNDRVINPVTEGVDLSLRLGDVSEGFFCRTPAWHRAQSVTRLSGSAGENGSS